MSEKGALRVFGGNSPFTAWVNTSRGHRAHNDALGFEIQRPAKRKDYLTNRAVELVGEKAARSVAA